MMKQTGMGFGGMLLVSVLALHSLSALASGEIGDHVRELKAHIDEYTGEVRSFNERVGGLVDGYAEKGADGVETDKLIEWWEEVKFHAAIETNYAPVYAAIWQGIYGVKKGIENGKPVAEVRKQQRALEHATWQGLGAVKLAAKNQASEGHGSGSDSQQSAEGDPVERIITNLEKVTEEHSEGH